MDILLRLQLKQGFGAKLMAGKWDLENSRMENGIYRLDPHSSPFVIVINEEE
jgi:hypothetical protein